MRSIERKRLEQCDAVVVVIDLHTPTGSAMVAKLSQAFQSVASTVALTRRLRCNYMVVFDNRRRDQSETSLVALPCFDQQGLRDGLAHAHQVAGRHGEVGYLLMPEGLVSEVGAEIAILQAKDGRPPKRRPS